MQQKLIFQSNIRAKYHKLTAIDTEELLIYKIIIFSTYMNWKIVYADAVIICLGLIHSDLACFWAENIYVRFLFPINKLNGRGRAELIVLYLAPPLFPGDGGRCRVF